MYTRFRLSYPVTTLSLVILSNYLSNAARISQSNECTSDEIVRNVQCFEVIPKNKYEVPEYSTVTMRCVVKNQHGKVQWRAKNYLLGYDRNLPSWPRYRVIGSAAKGEHFFEIRNVTKSDTGSYECQVQPVAQKHPPLRRMTKLVVLVRPSPPEILYNNLVPSNSKVIISSLNKSIRSTFTCASLGGVPKVKFSWFINSVRINKKGNKKLKVNIKKKGVEKSVMSLLTRNLVDGDVIKCRVTNRALEVHHDPDSRYLDAEVIVERHSPPGKPQIIQITPPSSSQGTYVVGDIIRAKCISYPAGKPRGAIMWKWVLPVERELYNRTEDISTYYYKERIEDNKLISDLTLPALKSDYHGAKLLCVTRNTLTVYEVVAKKILIKYPPREVKISTSDDSMSYNHIGPLGIQEAIIYGNANSEKYITCTTTPYYNEAKINWRLQTLDDSDGTETMIQKYSFQPTEKFWSDGESYRRNSTIKIKITKNLDKSLIDCQAWSGKEYVEARARFNVTYPPDKPVITGHPLSTPVKVNNIIQLICTTEGGNPYPNVVWYRNNEALTSTFPVERMASQTSLKIRITPKIEDNNAQYFCVAKNRATFSQSDGSKLLRSDPVQLKVLFPPKTSELISLSGESVRNGRPLRLQCTASESRPRAQVRWKLNRCDQLMIKMGRLSANQNCKTETLTSSEEDIKLGKYSGQIVISKLSFPVTWRNHKDYVDCEIYNPEYGDDVLIIRKRYSINVTFPPQFDGLFQQDFMVEEGKSHTFNLQPIANPPVRTYEWFKGTQSLQSVTKSAVKGQRSKLTISKAKPQDMGNYSLIVSNSIGEVKFSFFLNVTFGPKLEGVNFVKISNPNSLTNLDCIVKANPANPDRAIVWTRLIPSGGYNDISNDKTIESFKLKCNEGKWTGKTKLSNIKYYSKCNEMPEFKMSSNLAIYYPDKNDVGIYRCIINNGIGKSVIKTFEVLIPFTPQIIVSPKFKKSAADLGKSATVNCYIRAEPKPSINWYFGLYNTTMKPNSKNRMSTARIRPGLYLAQLNITNLQRSDHGNYVCKAENSKGSDNSIIVVTGTSKPDVPMEFRIVNRSTESLTFSWIQGFNGGSVQTYRVRWKEKQMTSLYRYEDVASDERRSSIEFVLRGLSSGTTYLISVSSRNSQHGMSRYTKELEITTMYSLVPDPNLPPTLSGKSSLQNHTVLFIAAATVFGFVILVVNILVIVVVLRRRRQRNRATKLQARFNNPKDLLASSNGLILSRDDHLRDSNSNFLRSDAVELYPRSSSALDTVSQIYQQHHQLSMGSGATACTLNNNGISVPSSAQGHQHHHPLHLQQQQHHHHHNPHHQALRRSIPDDQKTFSSLDTGSDDAREDLLRRQKEFGCCGGVSGGGGGGGSGLLFEPTLPSNNSSTHGYIGSGNNNVQNGGGGGGGGSLILAYDPITNSHYYTNATSLYIAAAASPTGIGQPIAGNVISNNNNNNNGSVNSRTTLLANQASNATTATGSMEFSNSNNNISAHNNNMSGHINNNNNSNIPQLMNVLNVVPISNIRPTVDSISCEGNSVNSANLNNSNNNPELTSSTTNANGSNNNIDLTSSTPHRTRMVSPALVSCSIPSQREIYANELRKAQMTGNLVVNPAALNRQPSLPSPQHIISPLLGAPQIVNAAGHPVQYHQHVFENYHQFSSTLPRPSSVRSGSDTQNANNNNNNNNNHKYRCTDNGSIVDNKVEQHQQGSQQQQQQQQQQPLLLDNNSANEYVNPTMENLLHNGGIEGGGRGANTRNDNLISAQLQSNENKELQQQQQQNQSFLPRPNLI